jgi:hypothetical protein
VELIGAGLEGGVDDGADLAEVLDGNGDVVLQAVADDDAGPPSRASLLYRGWRLNWEVTILLRSMPWAARASMIRRIVRSFSPRADSTSAPVVTTPVVTKAMSGATVASAWPVTVILPCSAAGAARPGAAKANRHRTVRRAITRLRMEVPPRYVFILLNAGDGKR